jgi:cAMP-specific phosphodiesterase 4
MELEQQMSLVTWILYESEFSRETGRRWVEHRTFERFHEAIRQEYDATNPYHNYTHACDVTVSVYRWFKMHQVGEWMDDLDQLALLVSAVAHDVGHPGRTTQFLVETGHELAIRYNDRSPLESMHCSKLFDISRKQAFSIFAKLDGAAYKKLRKTVINCIIATDNAMHFDIVKDLQNAYKGSCSDICDQQARASDLSEQYKELVLKSKDQTALWQQVILHLCDVANPFKGWNVSKAWAYRVQDEFFLQGDEEKRLGISVGFLNDRDKVDRNSAEHGFINFLVAPLMIATVNVFPHSLPMAEAMLRNLKNWRDLWVSESKPGPEDVAKKDADIKKLEESVVRLQQRVNSGHTPRAKLLHSKTH